MNNKQGLRLHIKNKSDETKQVMLFGYAENKITSNFGNDNDVVIKPKNQFKSYVEAFVSTKTKPIYTKGFILKSTNVKQLTQILLHTIKKGTESMVYPIITESYKIEGESDHTVTVVLSGGITFDRWTFLNFPLLANTELEIEFF